MAGGADFDDEGEITDEPILARLHTQLDGFCVFAARNPREPAA